MRVDLKRAKVNGILSDDLNALQMASYIVTTQEAPMAHWISFTTPQGATNASDVLSTTTLKF